MRAGRQAHDRDEAPGQVAAAGHQLDGHRRPTGTGEVVVDRAGRTTDRGVSDQPHRRPARVGDLDGGTDLEVLQGLGLAAGAQQHPRAALAGQQAPGAVDRVDDVAPRAARLPDDQGLIVALHIAVPGQRSPSASRAVTSAVSALASTPKTSSPPSVRTTR